MSRYYKHRRKGGSASQQQMLGRFILHQSRFYLWDQPGADFRTNELDLAGRLTACGFRGFKTGKAVDYLLFSWHGNRVK